MRLYGYVDFLSICRVDDPNNYHAFFKVKNDGVWMLPPDDASFRLTSHQALAEIFLDVKDFSTPVLPFPCTRIQMRDFLKKWGLDFDLDLDSEILLEDRTHTPLSQGEDLSGKWYSLEDTAQILGMPQEEVFRRIIDPIDDPLLFPSIVFNNPVEMKRRSDGKVDFFEGLFEIEGAYECHLWDRAGHLRLTYGGKSRVQLHQDGETYLIISEKRIRKSELVISFEELEHYSVQIGLEIKLPQDEQQSIANVKAIAETDLDFVARMRTEGKPIKVIVLSLLDKFGKITNHRLGSLLPANPGAHITSDAKRQRGQRLKKMIQSE